MPADRAGYEGKPLVMALRGWVAVGAGIRMMARIVSGQRLGMPL